jgi:hypothetical protein
MDRTQLIYTGVRSLQIGNEDEVPLVAGLSLVKPNPFLLSGRMPETHNQRQYKEAEKVSRYLVYRYQPELYTSGLPEERQNADEAFYGGLMAIQIVKPVSTLGFIFRGEEGGHTIHASVEERQPMNAGEWARLKRFDQSCLAEAVALIPRVQAAIGGTNIEHKNAITTLQLGLETYHEYIAGLLWVMGMEAIFDSRNRNDFKDKLCDLLGPDTVVFPDWSDSTKPPQWTVKDIALDLYTLRSKLAHGVDLRKAAMDRSNPVDFLKIIQLHEYSEPKYYSMALCEAACYLLCQVIRKMI